MAPLPTEILTQIPISDETVRYGIDAMMIRIDRVSWFVGAFAGAIIIRMVAQPAAYVVRETSAAIVKVVEALKRRTS